MLCARIAALRRQKQWSQSELARRLRISPSAVGMYEQGRREPSADTIVALAREFGVSTDYLLTGECASGRDTEAVAKLLEDSAAGMEELLRRRTEQPFTRRELAALVEALLTKP